MNMTLEISYTQQLLSSVWPEWQITKLLGRGSYGRVYEILRDDLGTGSAFRCALKVLRMEADSYNFSGTASRGPQGSLPGAQSAEMEKTRRLLSDRNIFSAHMPEEDDQEDFLEDFVRSVSTEIDVMMQLKGAPNIVMIEDYAILREKGVRTILIRMEELATLEQHRQQSYGNLSRDEIIRAGTDICNALIHCERLGILHRDIKPSNIFYSSLAGYKLGDFGISRTMDSIYEQRSMTGIGTIRYMAPEVFAEHKYNNTVDIYSLGLTLYTLLNGNRPPFYEADPYGQGGEPGNVGIHRANIRRLKGEPLPPPAGADRRLADVICRACSPDPSKRFQTATEFQDALRQCLTGSGPVPEPGPEPPQPHRPFSPVLIAAIAAAGVILAAVLFLVLFKPVSSVSYTVRCEDTDGVILQENEYPGKAGEELTVSSPAVDGYIPQEEENTFILARNAGKNLVVFVYEKKAQPTGCTILCKDTDGSTIDTLTQDGFAGEDLTVSAPAFDEYVLEDEGQSSCTITLSEDADDNQVVFLYERIYLSFEDPALEYALLRSMELQGSGRRITSMEAKAVEELDLSGNLENPYGMIRDITGLSRFTGLKKLDLTDNLISDITELEQLTNLEWVNLEKNRVKDLSPLKDLKTLVHLDLNVNNIEDASPVMRLTNLEMLDLRDNNIGTIDGVKNLTKLKKLLISKNHISDISQVAGLYELDYLSLGYNEVSDISMLKDLKKLAVLACSNNRITDISVVTEFPLLYWLEINGNPVADRSPLKSLPKNVTIKE